MEQITLGQVALGITFLVGLITGITFLHKQMRTGMKTLLKDEFERLDGKFKDLNAKIAEIDQRLDKVDQESCKNFLVGRLAEIEKGSPLGDVETERFWEQYQHYVESGGNSYIKRKVEQLKEDGKL